ncbi:MAG: portal protein [Marinomonas sp.]
MAKLSDSALLDIVNAKVVDAETNRSRIDRENQFLEDRYNAEFYGTEVPGRSRFVSNDVKDAVQNAHDSLTKMFLGAGSIIKFNPDNPENKEQLDEAQEKTAFVDWLIRKQPESYSTQSGALTEILKLKAGIVKYFYEETESTEDHDWENITELEVQEQLQAIEGNRKNKEVEIVSHSENEDGTFNVTIRAKVKRQEIKVKGVPTGSFLISRGATSKYDAELVGDEFFKTRGELLSEGHSEKLVSELPSASLDGVSARYINTDSLGIVDRADYGEWASQLVLIKDLYVKVDYNGDGIAERRNIQKAGDVILVNESFDHVPYAIGSAFIVPHSVIGEGWGEQVTDIAEVNTAITRGILDNTYAVNNTKKAVRVGRDGVNLDEALSNKIGGVVQVKGERPLTDVILPLVTEFIGDKSLMVKQHMDQMKSNRVGGQLTSQGLDGDALSKETATRFNGIKESDTDKIAKVARNVAEVFYRALYEGVAWLLTHHQIDEVEFNVLGKSLKANPKKWKFDSNLDTEIGLGAGDNDKVIQNMMGAWQIHSQLKAEGSKLTDDKKGYNILNKMYKSMDVKDTSQIINDPEEPAEQLRADNEQLNVIALQQQQQIEQLSEQVRQLTALSEVEMIKAQTKIESDNKKAALDIAKLDENARQFNVKTAQDGNQHNTDTAVKLTDMEVTSGKDIEGSLV